MALLKSKSEKVFAFQAMPLVIMVANGVRDVMAKGKAMTPFQSGKVLLGLRIFNALLAISVILLGIKLSIALFSKSPLISNFPIKKAEKVSLHKPTLNELRACWPLPLGYEPSSLCF